MCQMPPKTDSAIPPGGVIGILGGGQLGRMTALAAARLGYKAHIFAPEADTPAGQVAASVTQADYTDTAALQAFGAAVDAVTLEFENVPVSALEILAAHAPVRPGADCLAAAQDRMVEKQFLESVGAGVAPYQAVDSAADIVKALDVLGAPVVVKTRRFGYDGKGQVKVASPAEAEAAWRDLGEAPSIAEGFIAFEREISVIAARDIHGRTAAYQPVENIHENHILKTTLAPAENLGPLAAEAEAMAMRAMDALGMVGLLAVEMFVTPDGRLLANEMAPRPHNSGHWSMDAALTCQFEQLTRAVMGLPLGDPSATAKAEMHNLLGDEADSWPELLDEPGIALHLYGKAEARPGRKMGHWNRRTGPAPKQNGG
jgi:5-(carboxyamino)imidazole ribonucleotide synthase